MNKKVKIILLILLILICIPDINYINHYGERGEGWEFMNFYYRENKHKDGGWMCFDVIPIPKYSYGYESMFFALRINHDYCEDQEYWRDKSISIFIGVEDWMQDWYFSVFYLSISDKDIYFRLFGLNIEEAIKNLGE